MASNSLDVRLANRLASELDAASELWRSAHVELSVPPGPLRVPQAPTGPSGLADRGHRRHCHRPGQRRGDPRPPHHPPPPAPQHPPPPPPPPPRPPRGAQTPP